jgi:hypothetical protein
VGDRRSLRRGYPSAPEAFSRHVPYFDAKRTKLAGAEPMHILWRAIEHLDEDFQRGGYVSPKSQNHRNSGLLVPALLTITAVELVVTQQAARRAGPPRSPLRIVAAQKRQRASACAQIIWTIPFNDCLYPHLFEQVAKFQALNQTATRAA